MFVCRLGAEHFDEGRAIAELLAVRIHRDEGASRHLGLRSVSEVRVRILTTRSERAPITRKKKSRPWRSRSSATRRQRTYGSTSPNDDPRSASSSSAPTGSSDAELIADAATESGFKAEVVPNLAAMTSGVCDGLGALVLVDSLADATLVVAADAERDAARERMRPVIERLQHCGQLHLVERPLERWLVIAHLTTALRGRRYQRVMRARITLSDNERCRALSVLSALPVGIIVTDAAGRTIATNAAFYRMWGPAPVPQSPEDLRAFTAWPAGSDRRSCLFEWRLSRVLTTGLPVLEEELEIEAFDGARRTILSTALPIHDPQGKLMGAVAVQTDITSRARAQRATRILSEATAALIESLDPAATLRTLGRLVVANLADSCAIDEMDDDGHLRRLTAETSGAPTADEAARLLAYIPSASGNSLAARVLKSGKPLLVSNVPDDWLATGPDADEHLSAFAKIGTSSLMVLPLLARGRPLGVLGIVSTSAERRYGASDLALAVEIGRRAAIALDNARLYRKAENAVRERDESIADFHAFQTASPVGMASLDRALRFVHVNDVLARRLNLPAEEIVGRKLEDVVPLSVCAQIAPLAHRVLQTGEPILGHMIVGEPRLDPSRFLHLLTSFVPLLDTTGAPRAVGLLDTDVTRLKEIEETMREEAVFRERFIGVLAHDLRNPLHAIVLSAGTLLRQEESAPPVWARTMGRIARAAERMDRMIGNLLDLARSREGGGIVITPKTTDVADVVRGVTEELEASYPGRHIEISIQGNTEAEVDADRIAQVVSNLACNALTYSATDSTVEIHLEGRDRELSLAVHNDGKPIPPETVKRIFLPFQRGRHPADCAGAPAMRGLGLGLFIVGEISRAHGGTTAVSSTAEEGTTFTVVLPRSAPTEGTAHHAGA